MFHWCKKRLVAWAENWQRREIARLKQETLRLKEELEQTTGKPVQFTPEEQRRLAEKAKGIDPEMLRQISVVDPEALADLNVNANSTENR